MENLTGKSISGIARAEYIEVEKHVKLHVTDAGEGRPIVLIPGWPLSDEMFEYQYNDLMNKHFRVIGITLRGFGRSSKPYCAYNYDVHAKDLKSVFEQLHLEDVVLCGFSMGGAIAAHYVAKYESKHVSRLILAGAATPSWTQREGFPYNLHPKDVDELIALNFSDRPKLLANFAKIFSASETSLNEGIVKWLNGIGLVASAHATGQCLYALRDTDLRDDLKQIKIPTLILHGKKDKICSYDLAEQTHKLISSAQLITFEHSGHSLFLEETKKFNAELIKFACI